jgi:hypothetical protein
MDRGTVARAIAGREHEEVMETLRRLEADVAELKARAPAV